MLHEAVLDSEGPSCLGAVGDPMLEAKAACSADDSWVVPALPLHEAVRTSRHLGWDGVPSPRTPSQITQPTLAQLTSPSLTLHALHSPPPHTAPPPTPHSASHRTPPHAWPLDLSA